MIMGKGFVKKLRFWEIFPLTDFGL